MIRLNHHIFDTLFMDVETVSEKSTFNELSPSKKSLWSHKASQIAKLSWLDVSQQMVEDLYQEKAAIYAEFGKIICISVGMFVRSAGKIHFRKKSFYGENENEILVDFIDMVKKNFNNPNKYHICGHNIREFDVPYICRRSLVNGIKLPGILDISGKKAWQLDYIIDTLQLWKFGDYKHYTSLALMCEVFDIPSPKNSLDGSKVGEAYWKENKLDYIAEYCEQDVEAVAYLLAKMVGRDDISIQIKEQEIIPLQVRKYKAS